MEWLTYLLKVTACTVLFFGFYVVVLRKLTFFKINRFYLLVTLLLSFIIPALQLEIKREITVVETEAPVRIPEIKPAAQEPVQLIRPMMLEYQPEVESKIDWMVVMYFIYGGTASLLLLACLWQLLGLLKYTGSYTKNGDGLKLISKTEGFTNCSFFNYVFINHNDLSTADLSVLLKHEQVHVKQYHSIDKIILMAFKAVLWFSPIVVKIINDGLTILASSATYSKNLNTINANKVKLLTKDQQSIIVADSIHLNIETSKAKVFGRKD
ncbi:hypothetical protein H9N25_17350 [Pedobacter riviphilus]|uniref:Peptidase M56 domain-containing protein n=1 Tax=Pedobacter riviphilus TaxID=2766984 RepID=A0ABX6TFJ0_9SPHI|nr:hypothetical protein [Pedobacter riviphilus]QNR83695.1 hypothetical protein H9N25_17350 [Pedobacter riviphilus]